MEEGNREQNRHKQDQWCWRRGEQEVSIKTYSHFTEEELGIMVGDQLIQDHTAANRRS